MAITEREQSLLDHFRKLAPSTAGDMAHVIERIANGTVDWSTEWSEEDERDFTRASLERFDRFEREEA